MNIFEKNNQIEVGINNLWWTETFKMWTYLKEEGSIWIISLSCSNHGFGLICLNLWIVAAWLLSAAAACWMLVSENTLGCTNWIWKCNMALNMRNIAFSSLFFLVDLPVVDMNYCFQNYTSASFTAFMYDIHLSFCVTFDAFVNIDNS